MKFTMYEYGLALFILLHLNRTVLAAMDGDACVSSIPTMQNVPSCPSTEADWNEAAKRKKCSYVGQNCTSPDRFRYHCLINSFENATLEVCAPVWRMNGYCPTFNVPGQRIQTNWKRDCTKDSDKCPNQYDSSEVYKYPSCFILQRLYAPSSKFTETQYETSTFQDTTKSVNDTPSQNEWTANSTVTVVLVLVIVLVFLLVAFCILFRKLRNRGPCRKTEFQRHKSDEDNLTEDPHSDSEAQERLIKKEVNIEGGPCRKTEFQKHKSDEDNLTGTEPFNATNPEDPHSDSEAQERLIKKEVDIKGGPCRKTDFQKHKSDKDNLTGAISSGSTHSEDTHDNGEDFIVAAINLGTSHTKYGFCDRRSMNPEVFVQPSVILLNSDKEFQSFGDEANDKYLNLESHDIDGHHYFRNFSILRTIPNLKDCKDKIFADQKGRPVKLSKVFIDTFTYLKKEISEKADKKFPNRYITHWIVCVPLTWKKDAVEFLKSAVEQAGITTNLHVVNEHKAVLRWFSEKGGQENKDGTSLFVDLGGGITKVYGVTSGKEWIACNDTGGLSVLTEFQRYMEKVFTPEVYEGFSASYREDSFELNRDIIRIIFSHDTDTTKLQSSPHFENLKQVFRHINVDKKVPKVDFQDIDDTLLKPLKQNIEELIKKAVSEFPSIGTVFVFGGASKSDNLYKYVKSLLKDTRIVHVERFEHPDMAIIGGSIIEGINLKR